MLGGKSDTGSEHLFEANLREAILSPPGNFGSNDNALEQFNENRSQVHFFPRFFIQQVNLAELLIFLLERRKIFNVWDQKNTQSK